MIARAFVPPTFKVDATDEDGSREQWLTSGESEAEVVQRLQADGWTVNSAEPYNFSQWVSRSLALLAEVETARSREESVDFRSTHWKLLKRHLFELFGGKCAYCEAIATHVSAGDVEHYRPKKRVKEDPEHPGYYWLAYEAENLLPACESCNRASGKMSQFPVEPGTRATDPSELGEERPLLLNPYLDRSPLQHLRFLKTGHIRSRTEKGQWSIDVYNLKRRELRLARARSVENLEKNLEVKRVREGLKTALGELIAELRAGKPEFSAAQLSYLDDWMNEERRKLDAAREDLPSSLRDGKAA